MTSAPVVEIDQKRPRRAAGSRGHPAGQSLPGSAESLSAALASAVSLLETTARLQKETAEILCALAAQNQNEAVTQQLRLAQGAIQALIGDLGCARDGADQLKRRPQQSREEGQAHPYAEPLTAREKAVLRFLQGTLSNREIGHALHVSQNTIKTHARAIYRKLGASNRQEAIQRGRELGIIPANHAGA